MIVEGAEEIAKEDSAWNSIVLPLAKVWFWLKGWVSNDNYDDFIIDKVKKKLKEDQFVDYRGWAAKINSTGRTNGLSMGFEPAFVLFGHTHFLDTVPFPPKPDVENPSYFNTGTWIPLAFLEQLGPKMARPKDTLNVLPYVEIFMENNRKVARLYNAGGASMQTNVDIDEVFKKYVQYRITVS